MSGAVLGLRALGLLVATALPLATMRLPGARELVLAAYVILFGVIVVFPLVLTERFGVGRSSR